MATIRKLRGRWQAMVRRQGVQPQCKSFDAKTDAEKWARSLEAIVDRGGILPDTRLARTTTVADVLSRYQIEVTPRKRSRRTERSRINMMLRQPIAHRTLTLLTSADIATYRDTRLKTVATSTVLKELNLLSHALDTAVMDWGIPMPANPCKLVRRPKAPRGRKRRLALGEEEKLLTAADLGRSPVMREIIILAIETGMRRGELLGLEWQDINFTDRIAHLDITKNGESRDVPLSIRAYDVFQSLWEGQSRPERGSVLRTSASAVCQAFGHLCGRAGSRDLRFHDLRHEAVSRLFEKGLGIAEVSTISGHKELRMLQRYTHLRAVDLVARLN